MAKAEDEFTISVTVSEDTVKEIERIEEKEQWTRSYILREGLKLFFKKYKKDESENE